MLLISRRVGEVIDLFPDNLPKDMTVAELFFDGKVSIEVREISGNQVRLGILAPKNLTILRKEVKNIGKKRL